MPEVRRNPLGGLRFAKLVQYEEVLFWDRSQPPAVAPQDTDSIYVVKMTDRSDLVAARELGSSQLGWAIMERQDQTGEQMRLWPNDWYPGRKVYIPSRDSLSNRGIA